MGSVLDLVVNEAAQLSGVIPFAAGRSLVIVASDATGFGSGGTSDVYVVQPSAAGVDDCVVTYNNDTYLEMVPLWTATPYQCGPMLGVFNGAAPPIRTAVIVPGGQSFVVSNAVYQNISGMGLGTAGELWNMTVPQGTEFLYYVSDANGLLFVSGLETVLAGSTTCYDDPNQEVYSSTAGPAAGAISTSTPAPSTSSGSGTSNAGAIAGGVVGGLAGLVAMVAVVMFAMHRYNRRKRLLRRQTIGLVSYANTKPPRLDGDSWGKDKGERLDEET